MTGIGPAEQRVTRLLFLSLAIAGAVYSALGFAKFVEQLEALEFVFGVVTWSVVTACPLLLGASSHALPVRVLKSTAWVYGLLFVLTLVAWRPAMTVPQLPGGASPWANDIITVAVVAVAIAATPRATLTYVGVATLLSGAIRYLASPELGVSLAVMDTLFTLLTNTVFASLVLLSRRSARGLDQIAVRADAIAAREAALAARNQQRTRIDALTHDQVLSTLLVAARDDLVASEHLRAAASTTLALLQDRVDNAAEPIDGRELFARVRYAVSSIRADVQFDSRADPDFAVPGIVVNALVEAAAEAARNSIRYAGIDAIIGCSVQAPNDRAGVTVEIRDDGSGFDVAKIADERLGIRLSIVARMRSVPGGSSELHSEPGRGTRVTLTWSSP